MGGEKRKVKGTVQEDEGYNNCVRKENAKKKMQLKLGGAEDKKRAEQ